MLTRVLSSFVVTIGVALLLSAPAPVRRSSAPQKFDRAVLRALTNDHEPSLRVIVRARPGTIAAVRDRMHALGAAILSEHLSISAVAARVPREALSLLSSDPRVTRISSDAVVRTSGTASSLNDNLLLATLGLLDREVDGQGVGVAVVDSGIKFSADLPGNRMVSYDFTQGGVKTPPGDDYGHGTHVAGLIASLGRLSNDLYQGVAPGVRLVSLKVLDSTGAGYTTDVVRAIEFAIENRATLGIDIINLSLGHPIYEPAAEDPLVQVVERAVAAGIVVVTSSGNFGGDPATHEPAWAGITSPGNAPSAITVGALDIADTVTRRDDTVAWYSSRGPTWYDAYAKPDLVAPGHRMVSDTAPTSELYATYPGGLVTTSAKSTKAARYLRLSGTSMAAAVTSGVVALVLEANRAVPGAGALTPNAVKAILEFTAFPLDAYDLLTQGAGALNGAGAVALAGSIDATAPRGSSWLAGTVSPYTTIDGESLAWGQRIVWGDRVIWGNYVYTNDPAWALRVIWGDTVVWGNRVIWGDTVVWGSQLTWASRVIWGNTYLGVTDGTTVVWGDRVIWGNVSAQRVIWGNLAEAGLAPAHLSWGSALEISNRGLRATSAPPSR